MELGQSLRDAFHILEEERVRPTLKYDYVSDTWPQEIWYQEHDLRSKGFTPAMAGTIALAQLRMKRPREVQEDPKRFKFESLNFNLLLTIMSQLASEARPSFILGLLKPMLAASPTNAVGNQAMFPCYRHHTSSLTLLLEFCVRNGYAQALFDATLAVKMPSVGICVMLLELEELLSLNFNLFSRVEIDNLPTALAHLREVGERQTWSSKAPRGGGKMVENPHYRQGFSSEGAEMVKSIDAIGQQCNQARFFYIKGALQQTTNLEIESDKTKVIGFLDSLGFDPLLTASLARAEQQYSSASGPFDWKDCLGHIRSFYEHMNIDAGQAFAKSVGTTCVDKWDPTLTFFKNKGFFTDQQGKFARGLYTLLSDEGVHPLMTEREFARLLRNMVIEYGLMFLTMLEKKGIKI
jgi:hypothetical protein